MSGRPESPPPLLRVVPELGATRDRVPAADVQEDGGDPGSDLFAALRAAEKRADAIANRVAEVRLELEAVRADRARTGVVLHAIPQGGRILRASVGGLLVALFGLALWARAVDYPLRVTSDTPTFLALLGDMAEKPFASQSPFLEGGGGTQHATPYMQALAFLSRLPAVDAGSPVALGQFLALVGIIVFGVALGCVFLYTRRLAGSTAAWASIPVLLALFGPPHVIWASDLSLHGALYASFFPQTLAMATLLLTLLVLERRSRHALAGACALAAATMLVHPFTGVLLAVVASADACRLAAQRDRAAIRTPIVLVSAFLLGSLWPAYSLDRAFAETGLRGVVFISLCAIVPLITLGVASFVTTARPAEALSRLAGRLGTADAALRLALVGAVGTAVIAVWELMLVASPPDASARLAIYWVDDRWRWPLLLVTGVVGLSGLARLARRGHVVPAVWFTGCFAIGALGAIGLPFPVWYRFLLLCQVPLAVGVAAVVAGGRREMRTIGIVAATVVVSLGVKVGTLIEAPPKVSYFGQSLQPVWELGQHIPRGPGLVATDPATAYFIPATTGRRVLTVDKGHVSSGDELAEAAEGYALLRRFYAGGDDWWAAAQEMWRRNVRYTVVAKQTTLDPKRLEDFIWQSARLRTAAERRALGNYFYENNRIGTLVFDSPDFAVYRLDRDKLFPAEGGRRP
jgi:hypothetical protein